MNEKKVRSEESFQAYNRAREAAAAFVASLKPGEDLLILCGYTDDPEEKRMMMDCFGLLTQEFVKAPIDILHQGGDEHITILAVSRSAYLGALNKKFVADAFSSEIAESIAKLKRTTDRANVLIASRGSFRGILSMTLGVRGEIQ